MGIETIKREIESNIKLRGQNKTAEFHEIFESQSSIYLTFEYVSKRALSQIDNLDYSEVKSCMKSLLQGISQLEDQKIVHRDLKPDNIMLVNNLFIDSDFDLKIIDFGLAASFYSKDPLNYKCGSIGFIAPEILNSSKKNYHKILTSKVDIFSAGVIFYYLLTGEMIFDGENTNSILQKNKKANINISKLEKTIQSKRNDTPPECLELMLKMLNPHPEQRPDSTQCLQHNFFNGSDSKINYIKSGKTENFSNKNSLQSSKDNLNQSVQDEARIFEKISEKKILLGVEGRSTKLEPRKRFFASLGEISRA